MATKKAPTKKVNELAQALTLLNKTIAPQPEVQAQQQALEKARKQLKPSQTKVEVAHLLPFEGSALLALQLDGPVKPVLVKLFDRGLQVPLLASAGAQVPGSLGANGTHVFAQFAGLKLQPAKSYQFELVFEDNTHTGASAAAELVGSNNVRSVLALCTEGQAALAVLLKAEHKKDSELRKLVAKLIELEKRYVSPYVGKVDEIIGGVVEGWVWCPAKPMNRYEVQAWCGDRLVGYGMANLWREDLERLKKDDGRLKFEIPLARHLFDGQTHTIQMKIVGQGEPDVSMNFGQPLEFNAPKRNFNNEHLQFLMAYSLSQKVAGALAGKLKDVAQQQALTDYMHKVCLHLENREPAQARQVLELAMQQAAKAGALWNIKFAESYMLEKQFDQAVEHYSKAVKAGKDFIWAHMGLGVAYQQKGDKAQALKVFENAETISPNYAPLQAKLSALRAEALLDLKDTDSLATEQLEKMVQQGKHALVNNPDNRELSRVLVRLQQRLNGNVRDDDYLDEPSPELDNLQHHRLVLEATLDLLTRTRS